MLAKRCTSFSCPKLQKLTATLCDDLPYIKMHFIARREWFKDININFRKCALNQVLHISQPAHWHCNLNLYSQWTNITGVLWDIISIYHDTKILNLYAIGHR